MNNNIITLNEDDYLINNGVETNLRDYIQSAFREGSTMSFTGMVDDNSSGNVSESLRRRVPNPTMARFAETNNEAYNDLAKEIEEMGNIFFDYVTGKTIKGSWRYLSDVILYRNSDDLDQCLRILREYGRTRRNGMFGFSVESDHIHVIHDCAFSGGHCRDVWRYQIEPFGELRPTRKQNKPIWKFTRTDWYDVFKYMFLEKRGTREIYIRSESWKVPDNSQLVRWEEKLNSWGQMVRCEDSGSDDECRRQDLKRSSRAITPTFNNEVHGKKSKTHGKFFYIKSQTKALLLKYYCTPISAIRDMIEFRTHLSPRVMLLS